MSQRMDGCWAKIERADEHINKLGPKLDAFVAAKYHAYRVIPKFNRETGEYTITAFDDGGVVHPLRFSVIIGEVVHQLRSSLDHLIWALASARHANPPDRIGFPICESRQAFERAAKQGMIAGISGNARGIVDSVQPYRQKEPRQSFLFRLHYLSNIEKHRLLIVTCGLIANPRLDVDPGVRDVTIVLPPPETATFRRPSKEGVEIIRLIVRNFTPETKINGQVTAQVAFEQFGPEHIVFVIPGLKQMRDAVVQTLELFRGEF